MSIMILLGRKGNLLILKHIYYSRERTQGHLTPSQSVREIYSNEFDQMPTGG